MVIPAASSVCSTPSIANFESSSAVIPALPDFGSIPTCPPTYSTSPTRTPSLKGTPLNSAGRGKTTYFRSASAEIEQAVNSTKTARLAARNFIQVLLPWLSRAIIQRPKRERASFLTPSLYLLYRRILAQHPPNAYPYAGMTPDFLVLGVIWYIVFLFSTT